MTENPTGKASYTPNLLHSDVLSRILGPEALQILRCGVCADFFEVPIVLPCGHTFCLNCLTQICQHASLGHAPNSAQDVRIGCPSCRVMIYASPILRRNVTCNFIIQSLIECLKARENTGPTMRSQGVNTDPSASYPGSADAEVTAAFTLTPGYQDDCELRRTLGDFDRMTRNLSKSNVVDQAFLEIEEIRSQHLARERQRQAQRDAKTRDQVRAVKNIMKQSREQQHPQHHQQQQQQQQRQILPRPLHQPNDTATTPTISGQSASQNQQSQSHMHNSIFSSHFATQQANNTFYHHHHLQQQPKQQQQQQQFAPSCLHTPLVGVVQGKQQSIQQQLYTSTTTTTSTATSSKNNTSYTPLQNKHHEQSNKDHQHQHHQQHQQQHMQMQQQPPQQADPTQKWATKLSERSQISRAPTTGTSTHQPHSRPQHAIQKPSSCNQTHAVSKAALHQETLTHHQPALTMTPTLRESSARASSVSLSSPRSQADTTTTVTNTTTTTSGTINISSGSASTNPASGTRLNNDPAVMSFSVAGLVSAAADQKTTAAGGAKMP